MLLEQRNKKGSGQVAIVTRNLDFARLLAAILESWKYRVTTELPSAEVIFVEWGLAVEELSDRLVWLAPLPVTPPHFETPLQLQGLHQLLERRFFPRPRRQMRIPMQLQAELLVAGRSLPAQLTSLSGRGARLSCASPFAVGQKLTVDVVLGKRRVKLSGEVLYTLPAGDAAKVAWPQLGVLFKPIGLQLCEALGRFVEKTCVEQACAQLGLPINHSCVSWLDLPRDPWSVIPD